MNMNTQSDKQIEAPETVLNRIDEKGMKCKMHKIILRYLLLVSLSLFGFITVFLSASLLFDLFDVRETQGIFVPFIVIANFIAGILYLVAAWYFLKNMVFSLKLLFYSLMVLIVALALLLAYIYLGGIYQTKTIGAIFFRITINLAFLLGASYLFSSKKEKTMIKKSIDNVCGY